MHLGAPAAAAEARVRGKSLVMHGNISAVATRSVRTEYVVEGRSEVASKILKATRRRENKRAGLGGGGVEARGAVGLGDSRVASELWVRRRRLNARMLVSSPHDRATRSAVRRVPRTRSCTC